MLSKGYFFHGLETFLVDEAVNQVKKQCVNASISVFKEDISYQDVLQATQTTGLFASSSLLILKNPHFLTKTLSKGDVEKWKSLFKNGLNEQTCIVVVTYGKVDMRKACASFLKKLYNTQQFMPFKDWEDEKFASWVKARANSLHKKLSDDALNLFCQITGLDCRQAANELETLSVLTQGKQDILVSDIRLACPQAKGSIYDLTESMKTRDYKMCFEAITKLKMAGEDPIKLLGLVTFNIRFFMQLLSLKHKSMDIIAKELGKHPFFIKQVMGVIEKKYSLTILANIISKLAEIDVNIKSGKVNPRLLFSLAPALICKSR